MVDLPLSVFTQDSSFPFYICHGIENDPFYHRHKDFSELVVVLDGAAMHCADGKLFFVKKGDVFTVGQGVAHWYENTSDFHICNFLYRYEAFFDKTSDLCQMAGFRALFSEDGKVRGAGLKLSRGDFEYVGHLVNVLLTEYAGQEDGWKTVVHAGFISLCAILSRKYRPQEDQTSGGALLIQAAVTYIEQHYAEAIDMEYLARLTHMSERHFSRLFKNAYHITPGRYILNLRMIRACEMLVAKKSTIAEIAQNAGFCDSNYFCKCFRRMFGMTPREYRKNNDELTVIRHQPTMPLRSIP